MADPRPAECVASDVVTHYKADRIPESVAVITARDSEIEQATVERVAEWLESTSFFIQENGTGLYVSPMPEHGSQVISQSRVLVNSLAFALRVNFRKEG
jgi:hypothetical protein